jgi:hypothetical protein
VVGKVIVVSGLSEVLGGNVEVFDEEHSIANTTGRIVEGEEMTDAFGRCGGCLSTPKCGFSREIELEVVLCEGGEPC